MLNAGLINHVVVCSVLDFVIFVKKESPCCRWCLFQRGYLKVSLIVCCCIWNRHFHLQIARNKLYWTWYQCTSAALHSFHFHHCFPSLLTAIKLFWSHLTSAAKTSMLTSHLVYSALKLGRDQTEWKNVPAWWDEFTWFQHKQSVSRVKPRCAGCRRYSVTNITGAESFTATMTEPRCLWFSIYKGDDFEIMEGSIDSSQCWFLFLLERVDEFMFLHPHQYLSGGRFLQLRNTNCVIKFLFFHCKVFFSLSKR